MQNGDAGMESGNTLAESQGDRQSGRCAWGDRLPFLPQALLCQNLRCQRPGYYENGVSHGPPANHQTQQYLDSIVLDADMDELILKAA